MTTPKETDTTMETPREYTAEEVRELLMQQVRTQIDWWAKESRVQDTREKLEGLAHSIFATLDGCTPGLPAFLISPQPHPEDRDYCIANGENWFPTDTDVGPLRYHVSKR